MVQVLCRDDRKKAVIACILSETTSAGVRFHDVRRCTLAREKIIVETVYGSLQVKRIVGPGDRVRMVPEYEVCKKIALERSIPIRMVYDAIIKSLQE